jgi:hypothetical protein
MFHRNRFAKALDCILEMRSSAQIQAFFVMDLALRRGSGGARDLRSRVKNMRGALKEEQERHLSEDESGRSQCDGFCIDISQ